MKITTALLMRWGAKEDCRALRRFTGLFPSGAELTAENIERATTAGLDRSWVARPGTDLTGEQRLSLCVTAEDRAGVAAIAPGLTYTQRLSLCATPRHRAGVAAHA